MPDFEEIERCQNELLASLRNAAESLETDGKLPDASLNEQLLAVRNRLSDIRDQTIAIAHSVQAAVPLSPDRFPTIADIKSAWTVIDDTRAQAAHKERKRRDADAMLQRASRIQHRDAAKSDLLEPFRQAIITILDDCLHPEDGPTNVVEDLADGRHPVCALLALVEHGGELDPSDWDRMRKAVTAAFGLDVCVAAVQGKLYVAEPDMPAEVEGPAVPPSPGNSPRGDNSADTSLAKHPPSGAVPGASEESVSAQQPSESERKTPSRPGDSQVAEDSVPAISDTACSNQEDAVAPTVGSEEERRDDTADGVPPTEVPPPPTFTDVAPDNVATQCVTEALRSHAEQIRCVVWRLIADDRLCLAYHLAKAGEQLYDYEWSPPAPAIRALAISPLIRSSLCEAVQDMRECVSLLQSRVRASTQSAEDAAAEQMLIFAVSLRPTLIAPHTGAPQLLQTIQISDEFGALLDLRTAVQEFASLSLELTPVILKGVREHAAWQTTLESVRQKAREWLQAGRQSTIVYAAATAVFRKWLEPEGPLGRALGYVIQDQRDCKNHASMAIREWTDTTHIDRLLAKTDADLRGRRASLRPIEARAKTAIRKRVCEAMDLVRQWRELLEIEPTAPSDFVYQRADECRSAVLRHLEQAKEQLKSVAEGAPCPSCAVVGASKAALRALHDLSDLFDPNSPDSPSEQATVHLLHGDLLRIPDIDMDDQWEPRDVSPERLIDRIMWLLEQDNGGWQDAFERRSELRDHLATQRIIDLIDASGDAATARRLREVRAASVRLCREALNERVADADREIEHAVCYDLLDEASRNEYKARVESISHAEENDARNFGAAETALNAILTEILQRRRERVDQVRQRLLSTDIQAQHPEAFTRISDVLAQDDFLTANEYIDLILQGQGLPEDDGSRDVFREFFPTFTESLRRFLEAPEDVPDAASVGYARRPHTQIRNQISRGRSVGPINMAKVPGAQAEDAGRMLEYWHAAKNRTDQLRVHIRNLLASLGFVQADVTGPQLQHGAREWWADLECARIADRTLCPIPQYGSLADGHYQLLCVWDRPAEDEIVDLSGRAAHNRPLVVLYFGRMTEQRRRDLAVECRARQRTLLIIDEALIYYLCQERGGRMFPLMQCTFPFTIADPYNTTSGLVPQEMFYGRDRERQLIWDPFGTNLVYGGRQLGKTALLRDVERRYNDPASGILVKCVDLKAQGIGINRPIDDIWLVLSSNLSPEIGRHRHSSPDGLMRAVENWLKEDDRRRILLLLDEADAFLDSDSRTKGARDAQGYLHVARLKGLMDRTNRRFKVVFVGLHNVQRTAKDVNTPIAHLGSPVCIGPLLDNAEWREAMRLISLPLETLGYRFATPDLPMRILSYTNYYPSLIQLFCKYLLAYLTNPNRIHFDTRQCPPYVITAKHIEDVYASEELHREIAYRFNLTLDLDSRYRFIALRIALESIGPGSEHALLHGFDASWVRQEAMDIWPEGFNADPSLEAFHTLLDEMRGLGVLRRTAGNRFALRNPNVLTLLGTKERIEEELLQEREAPPQYTASSFHRAAPSDMWRRSPLTAQQESEILADHSGVSVVFGARVAGLEQLQDFLPAALPDPNQCECLDALASFEDMRRQLENRLKMQPNGLLLVIVSPSCPWGPEWVLKADRFLQSRTAHSKILRLLFVGDPGTAWSWTSATPVTHSELAEQEVLVHSLKPWTDAAVQRWLDDAGFGPIGDPHGRARLREVTGNWWTLLHHLGEQCRAAAASQWEVYLKAIDAELTPSGRWSDCFGFVPDVLPVLQTMAILNEPATAVDIAGLMADVPVEHVERVIRWCELLAFAGPLDKHRWTLDPIVRRMVPS